MTKKNQKLMILVLFVFAIIDIGVFEQYRGNTDSYHANIAKVSHLKQSIAEQKHKKHNPTVHKTVPSAYKKMIIDGKQVSAIENSFMSQSKAKHKIVNNDKDNKAKMNKLQGMIDGGSDDQLFNQPWTTNLNDKIKLIPGTATHNGDFECAFVAMSKSGDIDDVVTAIYEPGLRYFTNLMPNGTYDTNALKKQLHNKNLNSMPQSSMSKKASKKLARKSAKAKKISQKIRK